MAKDVLALRKKTIYKRCGVCHGTGRTQMRDPQVRKKILRVIAWIQQNVRRGSVLLIGSHYRKVVSVYRKTGGLTLVKIKPSRYHGDTTTYCVYDFYKKLKGVHGV